MKQEVSVELAGGKTISFETGKLAKQAHGSVVVRIGDNVVLATATANPDPREGIGGNDIRDTAIESDRPATCSISKLA